jgi:hypothetical protein
MDIHPLEMRPLCSLRCWRRMCQRHSMVPRKNEDRCCPTGKAEKIANNSLLFHKHCSTNSSSLSGRLGLHPWWSRIFNLTRVLVTCNTSYAGWTFQMTVRKITGMEMEISTVVRWITWSKTHGIFWIAYIRSRVSPPPLCNFSGAPDMRFSAICGCDTSCS